jgi:queuine tRNA-ribosyltransferase
MSCLATFNQTPFSFRCVVNAEKKFAIGEILPLNKITNNKCIEQKYANSFSVLNSSRDGGPRVGRLQTPHGSFETPCFLPVASFGDLRAISFEEAKDCGTQIIMVNAWHVYRQAGAEKLHEVGGIHNLIHWPQSIFTDSGGYQIFSLRETSKITDQGVVFNSESGSLELLTPEDVVQYSTAYWF